jgi:ATP-binding cassette subfamily B protein
MKPRPAAGGQNGTGRPFHEGRFKPWTTQSLFSYWRSIASIGRGCRVHSHQAGTSALVALFLKTLIDTYIMRARQRAPSMPRCTSHPLMGLIFLVGAGTTVVYNRIMVKIEQGTLKRSGRHVLP